MGRDGKRGEEGVAGRRRRPAAAAAVRGGRSWTRNGAAGGWRGEWKI